MDVRRAGCFSKKYSVGGGGPLDGIYGMDGEIRASDGI
jgi:hypothetical protein